MSNLERVVTELAATITPTPANEPRPVLRRWGTIALANADGSYDVVVATSTLHDVWAISGVYIVGEVVVVDFSGTDPMIVGSRVDKWHLVGGAGEPAFQNNWSNFDANWPTAKFRKVGGLVVFEGMVKKSVAPDTGIIFTLPAGYRPASPPNAALGPTFLCPAGDPLYNIRVDVYASTGYVTTVNTGIVLTNDWLSLVGISFVAGQ